MLDKSPSDRMKRKVLIENLWFFILQLVKKNPRYGNELKKLISEKFGFLVGNVTSYKVLYDLESEGYLKVDGDYRKKYTITEKGIKELKKATTFLKDLIEGKRVLYKKH